MPGALAGQRGELTMRVVEHEDVPFLSRANANPELRYGLGWGVKNQSQLESEIDDQFGHDEVFLVCLGEDDPDPGPVDADAVERIGLVFAGVGEWSRTGIGYWIAPEHQGNGFGKAAVSFLIDELFRMYPHPAVYAKSLPTNEASRGLLESLGFSQEGRLRKEAFWDGEYRDSLVYGLLREEWVDR